MTSAAPTVWPHCEVPRAARQDGNAFLDGDLHRDARVVARSAARPRRPARSGRSTRRWSSGRGWRRRTAPRPRSRARRRARERAVAGCADEARRLETVRRRAIHGSLRGRGFLLGLEHRVEQRLAARCAPDTASLPLKMKKARPPRRWRARVGLPASATARRSCPIGEAVRASFASSPAAAAMRTSVSPSVRSSAVDENKRCRKLPSPRPATAALGARSAIRLCAASVLGWRSILSNANAMP